MTLKQRVPLTKDRAGNDLFITIEWLKDLQQSISSTVTNTLTVTPADLTALQAMVNSLQVASANLLLQQQQLDDRVKKLEGGYQS